jgi:hypothetical protein
LGELETVSFVLLSPTDDAVASFLDSVRTRELHILVADRLVNGCDGASPLAHVASCTSLEKLDVVIFNRQRSSDDCSPDVRDAWLAKLCDLPRLREFSYAGCPIGAEGIGHLAKIPGLQNLELGPTSNLNASELAALRSFPSLRLVKLQIFQPVDAHLSGLRETPFDIEVAISEHDFTQSTLLADMARMQRLRALQIFASGPGIDGFSNAVWKALRSVPTLRELTYCNGSLSEEDCAAISRLPTLEKLQLQRTTLASEGIPHLCKSASLRQLSGAGSLNTADKRMLQQALPELKLTP